MSEHITHISDDAFEQEVLQSQLPVLVDYWAEWCGPCKMIAPILDEVSKEYAGRLKVAKLNIGTQLIAPVAHAVGIRQLDRPTFERAILLPELPTLKQETSMIAAPGTYSPARVLELDEDGRLQRIMIMRLVESTARFERFQFARL